MSSAYDIVMKNRQEIVDKLIAQMEKGYAATRAAWNSGATGRPYNPVSDVVYRGGNRLRLMLAAEENGFTDPRWMTFKQASEKNYRIAAGSKGVLLEKWIFHKEVPALDEAAQPVIGADGKPVMERIALNKPIVNYFRVFNGSQVIGLPELEHREVTEDAFSKMADTFEKSSLCPVGYEKQDRAYYSSVEDRIHMPPKESFKNNEARLSVLLHEMAHSTGHESRLKRSLGNGFGTEAYAKEELNAELSSVFLENELGIAMEPDSELIKDHANYVKSWISVLKDNPNELFVACANAEQITEFLMGNYEKQVEQSQKMNMEEKGLNNWMLGGSTMEEFGQGENQNYIKNVTEKVRQHDFGFMKDYTSEKPARFLKKEEVQTALELGIKVDIINNMEDYHGSHEGDFEKREMTKGEVEQYFTSGSFGRTSRIYISPDYDAVGVDVRKLEHILAESLVQHKASRGLDELTLEERYTEAMKMAGYERIEDADGFLVFKNMRSGEETLLDGWQTVGFELEGKLPLDQADATRYEELVHPQGRLSYYTQNLGGTGLEEDTLRETHKNFEEAFKAYTESGLVDGKTLGFTINGEKPLALVWYDSSSMENILYRASDPAMRYASDVAPNELETLRKDMGKAVNYLQKENAYVQLIQAVTEFEMRAMPVITQPVPEDITKEITEMENMTARFVSHRRPQDYFEIRLLDRGYTIADGKETRIAKLDVRTVHANEVVNEKSLFVHSNDIEENGIKAFADEGFAEWLHDEVINMDTDFMPYGQVSFTLYSPWGWRGLEDHYEELENRGYERFPADEQHISAEMELSFREEAVGRDIAASGFKPTQSLVDNIIKFEQLEGRNYTLKELAELKRQNPDFKGNAEKQACFEKIVTECQEQEMNREQVSFFNMEQTQEAAVQKGGFLKQEMMMEQMQMAPL